MIWEPKTQVMYIPTHARGIPNHPDIEYGFVTSTKQAADCTIVWCRFWYKVEMGVEPYLRTKSCSESVSDHYLQLKHMVPSEVVEKAWRMYVEPTIVPKESDGE